MQEFTFGEFFSGPGGMSLGALKALCGNVRMRSRWAVDLDLDACRTYHHNIHGGQGILAKETDGEAVQGINVPQGDEALVLNSDVRKVNPRMLADVDAFLFGFPCNDFSTAGQQKGFDGDFGRLYEFGIDLIRVKRPKFFVAENVSGLLHANNYGAFLKIVDDLRLESDGVAGYDVVPHLYKFEQYGIPQTRHRIIIVGIRSDIRAGLSHGFLPPAPTNVTVTAREALEGLSEGAYNHEPRRLSDIVTRRLRHIEPGQNIWDVNSKIPKELRLNVKGAHISSIYKVVDPDKPAYTVLGSGGGGTHMYHWDRRATTNRERARFQTFDDDFEFMGSVTTIRRQIGMAVPPEGARQIIDAVLKTISGIGYDSVPANLTHELDPENVARKRLRKLADLEAKRLRESSKKTAKANNDPARKVKVLEAA